MLASHSALWGSTGRSAMGVFQTLSAGNIGQLGAPGRGVPAEATPGPPAAVRPSHSMAVAANATAHILIRRLTVSPPTSTVARPAHSQLRTSDLGPVSFGSSAFLPVARRYACGHTGRPGTIPRTEVGLDGKNEM